MGHRASSHNCARVAGAFVATFIGQTVGWYRLDQGAGLIGATVGALVVLFIWNRLVVHRVISDPGAPSDFWRGTAGPQAVVNRTRTSVQTISWREHRLGH